MATTLQSGNRAGKFREIFGNVVEPALVEIDQIHLVHGEDELANAEQRTQKGVPPRLLQEPLPGVDQ